MSINNLNDPENKGNIPLSEVKDIIPIKNGKDINNVQDLGKEKFRYVIPYGNPHTGSENTRYIPKSIEEQKYTSKFRSLTDIFQPKDQYNRTIVNVVTNTTNILNEHIERLKRLLQANGERVYLVKRILDGEYCTQCFDPVTKVVKRKYCTQCYGTRIKGGYKLYLTPDTKDGKIYIAGPKATVGIDWVDYGRELNEENEMWTLPYYPLTNGSQMFSYDFIVRFNEDGTELGRYYIVNVTPSRHRDNKVAYQTFKIQLADRPVINTKNDGRIEIVHRGDVIYEIKLEKLDIIYGTVPPEWAIDNLGG